MIAEAQAWLQEQLKTIDTSGTSSMDISINTFDVSVTAWSPNRLFVRIGYGLSLHHALSDLRKKLPASEAKQLRKDAAEMIERAEKLEAQ
jgi:hypothetical protein